MSLVINDLLALPGSTFLCHGRPLCQRGKQGIGLSPLCFQKPKPQCLYLSITYSLCRGHFLVLWPTSLLRGGSKKTALFSGLFSKTETTMSLFINYLLALPRSLFLCCGRPPSQREKQGKPVPSPLCFQEPKPQCLFLSMTYSLCWGSLSYAAAAPFSPATTFGKCVSGAASDDSWDGSRSRTLDRSQSAIGRGQSIQNSPKSGSKSLQAIENKGDTRHGFVAGRDGLSG